MKLQDIIFLLKADRFVIVTNPITGTYTVVETCDTQCLSILSTIAHREILKIEPLKDTFKITLKKE